MKNNSFIQKLKKAEVCYRKKDYSKADRLLRVLLNRDPDDLEVLRLLAKVESKNNHNNEAIALLSRVLTLGGSNAQVHYEIASIYIAQNNLQFSLRHLYSSVQLDSSNVDAWNKICGIAGQLGMYEESIEAGEQAIQLQSSYIAYMNLGAAYDAYGNADKAIKCYAKADSLTSDNPVVKCKYADALICAGDKKNAEKNYRESIEITPTYTHPYRQISRLITYTSPDHEDFNKINNMLKSGMLNKDNCSHLYFALGKMYEDCRLYEESFRYLMLGNNIENKKSKFNLDSYISAISDIVQVFDKELISRLNGLGSESECPVFIIGMPRSGSTLVEQIISSHPEVYGAGELYWFGQAEYQIKSVMQTKESFPQCCKDLDKVTLQDAANNYISYISKLVDDNNVTRITNKFLGGFLHLGLIALMFPRAKIIHCMRDPLDTCFSIFSILFPGNVDFGHDLSNIGMVYSEYVKLMSHWKKVLPGRILDVKYEDLIQDQKNKSKEIIEYIGLDWNEQCLNFYNNKNKVSTISAFQIRSGIYTSSIDRWKNYSSDLEPLISILKKNNVIDF